MPAEPHYPQRDIIVFLYKRALLMNVAGPSEVFSTANLETEELLRPTPGRMVWPYRLRFVSAAERMVKLSCGAGMEAEPVPDFSPQGGYTLIIPGGPGCRAATRSDAEVTALAPLVLGAQRVVTIGSGVGLLAATGQLDGRQCVTHWRYFEDMRSDFPKVHSRADSLYTRDGKFYSSAGVSAGIDLCLELVEEDLGQDIASRTARILVVFVRRTASQPQISASLEAQDSLTPRMRQAVGWLNDNYHRNIKISDIAAVVNMSERNFARRFAKDRGCSPGVFLERIRLDAARVLFTETNLTIAAVSRRVGFASAEHLSRLFKRRVGLTPVEYRTRSRQSAARGSKSPVAD